MSFLNLAKSALLRPSARTAFIAVGVAIIIVLHGHWTNSNISEHQPVTARKMHIQSIPMCKSRSFVCWWKKREMKCVTATFFCRTIRLHQEI